MKVNQQSRRRLLYVRERRVLKIDKVLNMGASCTRVPPRTCRTRLVAEAGMVSLVTIMAIFVECGLISTMIVVPLSVPRW